MKDWRDRMGIRQRMLTDGRNLASLSEDGSHVVMQLTKGLHALVDLRDWPRVREMQWTAMSCSKAGGKPVHNAATSVRAGKGEHYRTHLLHRLVMGLEVGDRRHVVRTDTDGIDCRRSNLTVTDGVSVAPRRKQSTMRGNPVTSRYMGVNLSKRRNRDGTVRHYWDVRCTWDGGQHFLGVFPHTDEGEVEAAMAFDAAVREHRAPGARTNFPC